MKQMSGRTGGRRMGGGLLAGLLVLGLVGLVGCGGSGDDDPDRSADEARQDDESETSTTESTTSSTTTTTVPTTTTAAQPLVYEVDGAGTVIVNYIVGDEQMQNIQITLPWSEEQPQEPSRMHLLVTLTGSQGLVTCRIRRGTEILAEASMSADTGPLLPCQYPPTGVPPVTYPPGSPRRVTPSPG